MTVMGLSEDDQYNVLVIVAGILHLGNIGFVEHGNYAAIADDESKHHVTFFFRYLQPDSR